MAPAAQEVFSRSRRSSALSESNLSSSLYRQSSSSSPSMHVSAPLKMVLWMVAWASTDKDATKAYRYNRHAGSVRLHRTHSSASWATGATTGARAEEVSSSSALLLGSRSLASTSLEAAISSISSSADSPSISAVGAVTSSVASGTSVGISKASPVGSTTGSSVSRGSGSSVTSTTASSSSAGAGAGSLFFCFFHGFFQFQGSRFFRDVNSMGSVPKRLETDWRRGPDSQEFSRR
mmetsp:Transcript_21560/g.31276  ORF Transcript_21560/g.31276 Transcript_21560/m.31276 type:complete len:235 (-) Transcript_21560:548-1252(-)